MPELPEVETIRMGLEKRIIGKKIASIDVRYPKSFTGKKEDVVGEKVMEIVRRAKVLGITLEKSLTLLFHLKMTGQLVYRQELGIKNRELGDQFAGGHPDHNWHAKLPNSTTAIIFRFGDGSELFFNDLRKFGWCKVVASSDLSELFKNEYGPEPFDRTFDHEYLMREATKIPNRKIKQFLTDQKIIAGIGNIYADEILFEAQISPLRPVKDVKLTEWKKVVGDTKKVLEMAIKYGGTTDSDYVNAEGGKGGMQDHLRVYRKTGQPCPDGCGGSIKRIVVGGRGTHYCPSCQK